MHLKSQQKNQITEQKCIANNNNWTQIFEF